MLDNASAAKIIHLDIVLQASAPAAVADLAIRQFGVAILTQSMAVPHVGALTALVIADIPTPAGLAVVWKASSNPARREFLLHCDEAFSKTKSD